MGALFWRSKKIRQRPILLWGWLCGPRVSREAGCVDPVCLVGLAVWTPCVLWGWLCGPRVSCGAGCVDPVCLVGLVPQNSWTKYETITHVSGWVVGDSRAWAATYHFSCNGWRLAPLCGKKSHDLCSYAKKHSGKGNTSSQSPVHVQ
jgi:hypothetical protein